MRQTGSRRTCVPLGSRTGTGASVLANKTMWITYAAKKVRLALLLWEGGYARKSALKPASPVPTLPKWNILSNFETQPAPPSPLPDLLNVAVAEVDAEGFITRLNGLAGRYWDWQAGDRLPMPLRYGLAKILRGASKVLEIKPGGLDMLGLPVARTGGWLLIGYDPAEAEVALPGFRTLIEQMPAVAMRLDRQGRIAFISEAAARMTGFDLAHLHDEGFWETAVHEDDRWKARETVQTALEAGNADVFLRMQTRHGRTRWIHLHLFHADPEAAHALEAVALDVTEQREMEAALFQSESLYRTFLEQNPLGLLHLDAEGHVTFENEPFRTLLALGEGTTWIGRNLFEVEGLEAAFLSQLEEVFEDGVLLENIGVRYQPPGSVARDFVVNAAPLRQPAGEIIGAMLMIDEVTQQKQREAALLMHDRYNRAEARLREAAFGSTDYEAFLHAAVEILGEAADADRVHLLMPCSLSEGCTNRVTWTPEGEAQYAPLRVRPQEVGLLLEQTQETPYLHLHADGSDQPLLALTQAAEALWIPFQEGEAFVGVIIVEHTEHDPALAWQDTELPLIADLVQIFSTMRAWMQVDQRYRLTISAIDDCLFNYALTEEDQRRYALLTEQIERLTGYAPARLMGREATDLRWVEDLVLEEDRALVRQHHKQLLRGQDSRIVYRVQHRNGRVRWLQEHAAPQQDTQGRVTVSGLLSDVTEQKEAEAVLLQAKQAAEASDSEKTAFIATMSHEIRTPLGVVHGYAELLSRELEEFENQIDQPLPSEVVEFVEAIQERSQRLMDLVSGLFDLSNLESGTVALKTRRVDVNALIKSATQKIANTLAEKDVALKLRLDRSDPILHSDPQRVEQILDQLLSNAAKFTESGSVHVSSRNEETQVRITIRDTGVGMSNDYLDKLFSPFRQEDNRLNRNFEGTGLGLALVKRLLDLLGGRIEVESKKGKGSTFRLFLPVKPVEG